MIILLDINALVIQFEPRTASLAQVIDAEKYRDDVIPALKGNLIVLITDRPAKYKQRTLHRIRNQLNWVPAAAYFNARPNLRPDQAKRMFIEAIFERYGRNAPYVAIVMQSEDEEPYARYGIKCVNLGELIQKKECAE
jgi:hypothetical protein